MKTLVIIPTYNESKNIDVLVEGIQVLPDTPDILVIDDNSPDGTAGVVEQLQQKHGKERIQLIVRQGKGGRGSAALYGFRIALEQGYDSAIEMDADLSHDPKEIPNLIAKLDEADVVIGSKHITGGRTVECAWYRRALSNMANFYTRTILCLPARDNTSGYRCYNTVALTQLQNVTIKETGFAVLPEISYFLHKAGMRFAEIPIVFVNRRRGLSKAGPREIAESFFAILRIRSHALYLHALQTVKFGMTGVFNAVLDLGILTFCVEILSIPLRASVVIASTIAITNAFFIHRHWTFQKTEDHAGWQYIRFLSVYGSSFVLGVVITLVLAEGLGVWYVLARLVAIPICAFWNYLWMHFGVFRK